MNKEKDKDTRPTHDQQRINKTMGKRAKGAWRKPTKNVYGEWGAARADLQTVGEEGSRKAAS